MTININVKDKVATVAGSPVYVCGNSDVKLAFTFDADWSEQPVRTARFVYVKDGEVKSTEVPFNSTQVAFPRLTGIKEVFIGVYASDLYTSTPARVPCAQSINCMAADGEEDLTPSQYEQILALINAGLNADSVKYIKQTLAPAQQAQARENLGVYSKTESDGELNAIRLAFKGLSEKINTVLDDSGDVNLDQLSEIVAYIKSNKQLIDVITGNKVNVSDIVDNLSTNATDKPLSAAQGFELKKLVDGKAPAYTYGTADIAAGSASTYPTGTLHFVYE